MCTLSSAITQYILSTLLVEEENKYNNIIKKSPTPHRKGNEIIKPSCRPTKLVSSCMNLWKYFITG
jgi:hypothetical protein